MQNNIIIIASLLTTFSHGMEKTENISLVKMTAHSLTLKCNETYFHLTTKPLSKITNKTKHTIIGHHQHSLTKTKYNDSVVGTTWEEYLSLSQPNTVDDNDNHSKNNTSKIYTDTTEMTREDDYKKMTKTVRVVIEPCVTQSEKGFVYNVWRNNPKHNTIACAYNHNGPKTSIDLCQNSETISLHFTGDKAIQEASKDLSLCYKKILIELAGYHVSVSNPKAPYIRPVQYKNINIAISAFSTDCEFPQDKAATIAIETIFNFLKEYPDGFDHIYFVVEAPSAFALYKDFSMKHTKTIDNIYRLYWMHKTNQTIISDLPYEILNNIILLMCNSRKFKDIKEDVL